jgi:Rho GTPase-activating protein 1
MHEVSLRAASNRMDAHNLAVVLCPNLVSGGDPMRDVAMCAVPGGPILYDPESAAARSNPTPQPEGKTTLGAIIKLCIHRYYEIFDEVQDRNEATLLSWTLKDEPASPGGVSITSSGSRQFSGFLRDDEDDIDDGVLVMPIEPSASRGSALNGNSSTSIAQQAALNASGSIPYKARHRNNQPGGRSVHAVDDSGLKIERGNGSLQGTLTKATSMISIDNRDQTPGIATRRGSTSVGRGTMRKSSGAGVEAINITAGGFFTSPNSPPSVSSLPSSSLNAETVSPRRS